MDPVLIRQNLLARDVDPRPLRPLEVWGDNGFLHICFSSVGCRFRKAGYCTVCDYGGDRELTREEAVDGLRRALAEHPAPVVEILLGTYGSILDRGEFPREVLEAVLEVIHASPIPSVILETHYTTVTDETLSLVARCLPGREVAIELGLESSDPEVLEHSLGKYMDLDAFAGAVRRIRRRGMHPMMNIFLGAPFLSPEEQLRDARSSLEWAVGHGAERVVIFPANIKPNTLLWKLWKDGAYSRISHWMLIELLRGLDDALLERVDLAWYGDRQDAGRHTYAVPPACCGQCGPELMGAYRQFMADRSAERRRALLGRLVSRSACGCRREFLDTL